jgi:NAD(P)-dependent dehydrogenase (short-subunit alcohol dehydrogenase family)
MSGVLDQFSLKGKIAVITGGAGLLGRKHAEAILEAGGSVALLDVNATRLEEVRLGLASFGEKQVFVGVCDITTTASVKEAKSKIEKHFGQSPDILINNAAIDPKFDKSADGRPPSRLENFPIEQWNKEISVGLTGAMICAQVFGYDMALKKRGVILNVASDLGVIAPDQRLYRQEGLKDDEQNVKPVTYSVIKHGLIGFTKYVATYWAMRGVRCNAFAPGGVFNDHPDAFVAKLTNLIPMGRMAQKDEYKAAIVFLVSDASSYMNGAVLNFDGGRSVW